jgi:hypothetical protein
VPSEQASMVDVPLPPRSARRRLRGLIEAASQHMKIALVYAGSALVNDESRVIQMTELIGNHRGLELRTVIETLVRVQTVFRSMVQRWCCFPPKAEFQFSSLPMGE